MLDHIQQRCRPVRLEDQPVINAIRGEAGHITSAHSFVSLFLWQERMDLSVCLEDHAFFVRFGQRGGNAWFYPCGSREAQLRFVQAGLDGSDFSLHYIRQEDLDFLQSQFPGRFRFEEARGDWEYVCSRKTQEELPGKPFRNLRAKVHKARKRFDWTVTPLGADCREAAEQVIRKWEAGRETTGDGEVIMTGMNFFQQLNLQGILLSDEEGPKAMAFGSVIAPGIFDLHATKTLVPRIDSYLKWELYRRLPPEVTWINQEEDLDIPGLRTNKEESVPDHMIPLWKGYPV